jgi:hypothetical protein
MAQKRLSEIDLRWALCRERKALTEGDVKQEQSA